MAKKHRTAAQKAATRRMISANKAKRHKNPANPKSYTKRHGKRKGSHRRRHRNPSTFGGGGFFKSFLTMDGALDLGAAFVAPMTIDFIQEKVAPTLTGWTKIAAKAALALGGGWAIDKFLKKRRAGQMFATVGLAVVAADAIRLGRGQMAGLSEGEADYLSTRPELSDALLNTTDTSYARPLVAGMGDAYQVALNEPYHAAMNDAFGQSF